MDQDWTTVTFRRVKKTPSAKHYSPERARFTSLANADCPGPKKCIRAESIQSLIRKRIEMKLTQEVSDGLCAFPRNTFKNIESNRIIPTEQQKQRIQQKFNIYLQID